MGNIIKLPPADAYNNPYGHKPRYVYLEYVSLRKKSQDLNKWIKRQYAKQDARCFYCRTSLKGRRLNVEHVKPISGGGTNDAKNLVLSCPPCNKQKGRKRLSQKEFKRYERRAYAHNIKPSQWAEARKQEEDLAYRIRMSVEKGLPV